MYPQPVHRRLPNRHGVLESYSTDAAIGYSASAVYDPTGRLLWVSQGGTTTRFLYDGTRLIGEYTGTGALLHRYVHGPGTDQPIAWMDTGGNQNWLYGDERGSVIGVQGQAAGGSGFKINKYDEYGVAAAGNLGRFAYTGQTWLAEFGLYNYKARVYNASIGRFMQVDPIGYADQMNLYGYVGEDPVNGSDPSGNQSIGQYWNSIFTNNPVPSQTARASADVALEVVEKSLDVAGQAAGAEGGPGASAPFEAVAAVVGGFRAAKAAANLPNALRGAKTVEEAGKDLAVVAGRNRVSATTAGGKKMDIDLAGKSHFDKVTKTEVPTPHVQESIINVGPNGQINTSNSTIRRATMDDIRTAGKIIDREQ